MASTSDEKPLIPLEDENLSVVADLSLLMLSEEHLFCLGWTPELIASRLPDPIVFEDSTIIRKADGSITSRSPERRWFRVDVTRANWADGMREILRKGKCISKTAVLDRPNWTKTKVDILLLKPDRVVSLKRLGRLYKASLYKTGRVEEIEKSGYLKLSIKDLRKKFEGTSICR